MGKYIIKRILIGIVIVISGALVAYAVIRCLPTSFIENLARQRASNPTSSKTYQEWVTQLTSVYGLDKGILAGFVGWLGDAVRGDFGESWEYGVPVVLKFKQVIGYTIILNVITLFVELLISIPLGIIAAKNQYKKSDYAITVFALMGISLPTFFLAILLK